MIETGLVIRWIYTVTLRVEKRLKNCNFDQILKYGFLYRTPLPSEPNLACYNCLWL